MRLQTFCLIAALAAPAFGAEWQQEPKSFRSIALGQPLAEQYPECGRDKAGKYTVAPQDTCWQSNGKPNRYAYNSVIADVFNLADIGVGDTSVKGLHGTSVSLIDGRVESVFLTFDSARFASFADLMTKRFGAPQARATQAYITGAGITVDGQTLVWEGNSVSITLTQFYGRIGLSRLDVDTSKFSALKKAAGDDTSKATVNNL
ncbi:hypothetical protein [Ralstonia insidiosa]|uniref:Uncharacterized protein n=1 Tax=Ralstonia insidiosa TaxID=190721 RepID=A0A848NXL6_9RALS|nr:hypothetical protein [Ralstonia insidiosa]NMV37216.1 hypothetical protein [Ralstonia insidiosa]